MVRTHGRRAALRGDIASRTILAAHLPPMSGINLNGIPSAL
jgi:hypothetical protein